MTDGWAPSRRDVLAGAAGLAGAVGASGAANAERTGETRERRSDSGGSATAHAGDGRWPSYRYGGGNAGHKPGIEPRIDGIEVGWSVAADDDRVAGNGVAIADGTAYVVDDDQTLRAVDLETGELSWQAGFEADHVGVPALTESKVLCYADRLWAFEIGSGAVAWRSEPGGEHVNGSPAVVGGTVAVNAGSTVTAYDLSTGETRWRHNIEGSIGQESYVAADGDRFYAAVDRDAADHYDGDPLVALNASDGSVVWSGGPETPIRGPVVTDGAVLYVRNGQEGPYYRGIDVLHCVDADTGEQRWEREFDDDATVTMPVVVDTTAVFEAGGKLRAVGLESGLTRWNRAGPPPSFAVGDRLFCTGFGTGLQVRSADTGDRETTLADDLNVWDGGAYADGIFVVPAESGTQAIGEFNKPPSAAFDYDRPAYAGRETQFDASGATDGDGSVARFEWDFDADGEFEETGERPTHTFDLPGEFDVALRVTDDDGATDTTTRTVAVERPPTDTPTDTPTATPTDSPTAIDESTPTEASAGGATGTPVASADGATATPTSGGVVAGGTEAGGAASGQNAVSGSGSGGALSGDAPTRIAVFVAAISAALSTAYVALRRLNDDDGGGR
jgi:outer membrane protein assembly factor BamB